MPTCLSSWFKHPITTTKKNLALLSSLMKRRLSNDCKMLQLVAGTQSRNSEASLANGVKDMEERVQVIEDETEETDITVKENVKSKRILAQNIQEI